MEHRSAVTCAYRCQALGHLLQDPKGTVKHQFQGKHGSQRFFKRKNKERERESLPLAACLNITRKTSGEVNSEMFQSCFVGQTVQTRRSGSQLPL